METSKLFGIASVFFGIISAELSMIFFISFPASVLAITFGIFAVKRFYRIVQALDVDSLIEGKWYT